jgi:lipopolysaccharide/colanic/teichoic acid biosynthesis glycosyltransferase
MLILILLPLFLLTALVIYLEDFSNPIYISRRVGRNGVLFKLIKFRSMRQSPGCTVDSTAKTDPRITKIGRVIRATKLDELPQLINILVGSMSFVGPRPNVPREVSQYTPAERALLSLKPGLTDFSSIIFSDLADILAGESDPDIAYNQKVRPWKSRYGLFYARHKSFEIDVKLALLTILVLVRKESALRKTARLLASLGAEESLVRTATRTEPLVPMAPVGSDQIVHRRC